MPGIPGGNGSDLKKRKAQKLLDVFEASIIFISFRSLAGSMEDPVKSREREHTSTTTVSACVPLTLWRSLDPVVVYKFCRGGASSSPEKG